MAIVNITPDSFYTSFGKEDTNDLLNHVQELLNQDADILDIGACSTRPNSTPVDVQEEWNRLAPALQAIRAHFPQAIISVDTFRAEIAERAILAGADIINDVYGGDADQQMWNIIAKYRVPYILTHAQEVETAGEVKDYDYTMSRMLDFFQSRLDALHRMGIADVIIDPGFGFAKTEQQNYTILHNMDIFAVLNTPILAGISRKSMLYKPLGLTPTDVLPATIAANTMALERGANILRVHDVAAAKQAIAIYSLTHKNE
ncbi:MAG: dihydropteroate synthase [Paludibacteraceae bacterium]|nr:dihydropteroate synthase [Paludibacteraceae bacterium]